MFKVSIFNNETEKVIHAPWPMKNLPHLLAISLKEGLSTAVELSFTLPYGNPGYSLITGLKTKVKVYKNEENIFVGRVLPVKDGMTSDGTFHKYITCEGALNYLNDTHARRWNFANKTPAYILGYILDQHNSKVDASRQIQLGTVEITQSITIDTNYETSLYVILSKIKNVLGGDIRVQERNGVLYLDYLTAQGTNNGVKIKLGYNLNELIREIDTTDLVNRIIPMGYGEGVNQLMISSVNSGIEYLEDADSIATYGLVESTATNKDIQNADTLKLWGQTVLAEKRQPTVAISVKALDLSLLSGHEGEKYELGDTIEATLDVQNIDVFARVTERNRNLLNEPWNPSLTISTKPITLSDQVVDLKKRNLTLENAPQGNTVIFPLSKAENCDSTHPIEFDLDIPNEAININKVYLNIHGRKYRADSKDTAAGGSSSVTSASGGSSSVTSASGGSYNATITSPPASDYDDGNIHEATTNAADGSVGSHYHFLPSSMLAMIYNHTHEISISIPSHSHGVSVPSHSHSVDIPAHTHAQEYGIVESTYSKNVTVTVNGTNIGVSLGDGSNAFDQYNIDITQYVAIGNNKIVISTAQNGRIDAIVYSQIFIQSK